MIFAAPLYISAAGEQLTKACRSEQYGLWAACGKTNRGRAYMNKKLPIYILIIYFIFVILILALQLAGRSKREFVAVGFNDRLDNAVVVYEKSPIMLKKQAQVFINDENRSETPIVIDNVTYLPMSFYKNGFDAIISYSKNKDQITLKYDNKALVMKKNSTEGYLSDAERDKKIELLYAPAVIEGDYFLPVRTFARVFEKELFYDDGLIIISDMKDIFDKDTEADSIQTVKELVYNLPVAGSYERIKNMYREQTEEEPSEAIYTRDEAHLYIICSDDFVYFVDGNSLIKSDNMPYGKYKELSKATLPDGFAAEKIDRLDDYVCVSGSEGERAALCIYNMDETEGSLEKHIVTEGKAKSVVYSDGYIYFGTLCQAREEIRQEQETPPCYVPMPYENMRYFPETNGNLILNICGINTLDFYEDPLNTAFFGVTDKLCFCGSGVYVAQSDENKVYGDSDDDKRHSNVYKLGYKEGEAVFEREVRIPGSASFASEDKPAFIVSERDGCCSFVLLDSLLETVSANRNIPASGKYATWGDNRVFLSDGGSRITVLNSSSGENLGSFYINEEKLYLYNDERMIGFSQIPPAEDEAYPAVSVRMYNTENPSDVYEISEEIINNADPTMFDELVPEMGDGIVIIPAKLHEEDDSLFTGYLSFIESGYYGLRLNDKIEKQQ